MMCVWGCGCSCSLVFAHGSLGTHQTAAHACGRLCTSRCGSVCLCSDLCPCGLCVHVHLRLVHAPVMSYVPLPGCAHQCKVVQDYTCPFHLLCGTRGGHCVSLHRVVSVLVWVCAMPMRGCAHLCGAERTHTSLCTFVGLCKPRHSCACLCRTVHAHMVLCTPMRDCGSLCGVMYTQVTHVSLHSNRV